MRIVKDGAFYPDDTLVEIFQRRDTIEITDTELDEIHDDLNELNCEEAHEMELSETENRPCRVEGFTSFAQYFHECIKAKELK